ncbi:MAG: ABC transporter ATP-binding protein [Lachnospiraceae bacterium]|nr:ABC transporter ATP-binding protein [Lachnospiraceae bacterium]
MKKYTKYIKPYLFFFIVGPLMTLTEVFGEIWIPRLMSMIINTGVANHNIAYILRIGLVMLGACMLQVSTGVLGGYFSVRAAVGFTGDIRSELFAKVQQFSFADLDDFSTGSLVTRLTNDLQQIQQMVMMGLRMALRSPGMLVGGLIMALTLNRDLALILLVVIPLLGVSIFLIMKTAYPRFTRMQTALDALNNGIKETLTNVRVVKSFVREDHEQDKFEGLNGDLKQRTLDALNTVIFMMPVMTFFMNLTAIAVVWFGGNRIIAGRMLVGDLTAFITYVTQILMSLMMLAMIILQSARSMASFKRVSEVMDFVPDLDDRNAARKDKEVESGRIEFKDVSFSYPDENRIEDDETTSVAMPKAGTGMEARHGAGNDGEDFSVLQHISFTIEPGETVGILGATGCGKTSLVQLIPRLYDATEGAVLVDGVDVRDYSLENLREGVGMVLQYNTLFTGTIAENLRWGNEDATDEEVRKYAEYAQADGFVSSFKDGYDTMIEQGGTNVSGGQKQRLCIARALLKKPKILILDDSTSAVDTATERMINAAFANELKDTTKLIIAQRIGSVKDADRIIVMDDGKIVDIGKHNELIGRCHEYQEIYYSQVERKEEVPA